MTLFTVTSRIKDSECVDCPKCGERAPWRCRAKSGRTTDPHMARIELANATPRDQWWSAPES